MYFRAIPYDWEVFLDKRHNRPENLSDKERREILARKPALEWSAKLPPTTDYKEKTFATPAPDSLKPGFYFIAASHDPKFGEGDNIVSMTDVWVSDLALVTRTRDGRIEGFVLKADSGEPVTGAEVSVWHLDNQGNRIADPTLTTDENGFFSIKPAQNRGYLFRARHNGQELATAGDLWAYGGYEPAGTAPGGADRLLHRPRDLPARPDHPIQGHLPLGGPDQGQLRGAQGRAVDGGVQGRERQGGRAPEAARQRLRLVCRQLHRPARPAHGPDVSPGRGASAGRRPTSGSRNTSGRSSR